MKRISMVLIVGVLAMFLSATTFAAEEKYGDEKSESQMQDKSDKQKTTTGMGEGEQSRAEKLSDVEDLKGKKVMDANNEEIGEVNSMLVDSKSGQVKYIMLTAGGVLGVGGEDYLIPWQALQTGTDKEGFQVNLSSEEMENAPKGAEVASQDQEKELHEFYGVSPEWKESGQTGEGMKQDSDHESGTKMDKGSHEKQKEGEDKEKTY